MSGQVRKFWTVAATLTFIVSLTACGGDDGGGAPPPQTGDSTPPTVSSTNPANGATGVAVNAALTATFSEQMNPATISTATFTVKDAANNPVTGTVSYQGTTATFTPSAHLAFSTTYTATITTGVTDLAGNHLIGAYSWNFTTGVAPDTTPPTVLMTTPAKGATGVPVNTTVTATFSEVMVASSLNTTTFTVKDPANNPVSGVVTYSGMTATFTPSAHLAFSTTYTATITTGATDLAGNNLVGDHAWTFISGAPPTVPSGSLVPEFGSGGVVTFNPTLGPWGEGAFDVLIADTALFVVGEDQSVGPQWHIEKRNLTTGAPVTAFGNGGVVTSNLSSGYDAATSMVTDGAYLYVVGYDMVPTFGDYEWRIEKRLFSSGELVPAFGNNGVITVNPHSGGGPDADIPNSIATDGTFLYVSGTGNLQLRIEKRRLSTGQLDTNFGTGGALMSIDMSSVALIQIRDSSLYVIGKITQPLGYRWRIEKRSLSTGDFITDFGTNGVVTSDLFYGAPGAATTDGDNLYVVGYGSAGGGSPDTWWVIEKRSLTTGDLVTTFGTGGVILSNPSPISLAQPSYAIVLDGSNLYVVVPDWVPGNNGYNLQWRVEKRSLSSGALISDFGSGGVVTSNPSNSSDTPYAIATDGVSLYVAGDDSIPGNPEWRIEKRAK